MPADAAHPAVRRRVLLRGLCLVGAAGPAIAALIRAFATDWMAASDNALIAIRAFDVFSDHSPLAGTPSSVSTSADLDLRHPGPILFDVLAVPVRVLGSDRGVPVTMALLNGAFALWAVWLAGRCAGLRAQVTVAVAVGALSWSMGWFRLVEPYNPHATMIPGLVFLVACWAISVGRQAGVVAAIVAGTFCLQVHIGWVYVIPFALLVAVCIRWLDVRARRSERVPRSLRHLALLGGLFATLWIQPIIDVVVNGGESNPLRLLRARGSSGDPLGVSVATRISASVVALPPAWTRRGFDRLGVIDPPAGVWPSLLALVVLVAVTGLLCRRLRHDVALSRFLALLACLLPLSVVAVALVPVHELFGFAPHEFRWLWVVGAVVSCVVGWAIVEVGRDRTGWRAIGTRREAIAAGVVGLTLLLNVTNLAATTEPGLQPREPIALRRVLDDLPFDRLRDCDGVAVDVTMGFPGLEASAVLLALREHGVEFGLDNPYLAIGFDRAASGAERCLLTIADETAPAPGQIANDAGVALVLTDR